MDKLIEFVRSGEINKLKVASAGILTMLLGPEILPLVDSVVLLFQSGVGVLTAWGVYEIAND